jgi:histidyl-tRNA synthetase
MKKADASGARFAVIVGDDEAAAGRASLKALRELKEQVRAELHELPALISGQ